MISEKTSSLLTIGSIEVLVVQLFSYMGHVSLCAIARGTCISGPSQKSYSDWLSHVLCRIRFTLKFLAGIFACHTNCLSFASVHNFDVQNLLCVYHSITYQSYMSLFIWYKSLSSNNNGLLYPFQMIKSNENACTFWLSVFLFDWLYICTDIVTLITYKISIIKQTYHKLEWWEHGNGICFTMFTWRSNRFWWNLETDQDILMSIINIFR